MESQYAQPHSGQFAQGGSGQGSHGYSSGQQGSQNFGFIRMDDRSSMNKAASNVNKTLGKVTDRSKVIYVKTTGDGVQKVCLRIYGRCELPYVTGWCRRASSPGTAALAMTKQLRVAGGLRADAGHRACPHLRQRCHDAVTVLRRSRWRCVLASSWTWHASRTRPPSSPSRELRRLGLNALSCALQGSLLASAGSIS